MFYSSQANTAALTLIQQFQRSTPASSQTTDLMRILGGHQTPTSGNGSPTGSVETKAAAAINAATIDWAAKAKGYAETMAGHLERSQNALNGLLASGRTDDETRAAIANAQLGVRSAQGLYETFSSDAFVQMMTTLEATRIAEPTMSPEERMVEIEAARARAAEFRAMAESLKASHE